MLPPKGEKSVTATGGGNSAKGKGADGLVSGQERALKVPLKRPEGVLRKDLGQVLDRLHQRVRLPAVGRIRSLAKSGAHTVQPALHRSHQPIHSRQGECRAQRFPSRFEREALLQCQQETPQDSRGQTVARQHRGEENRKGFSTPSAPSPIRAKHPLPPLAYARTLLGRFAPQAAVAVQCPGAPAVWTAALLERKSSCSSSSGSLTKRNIARFIQTLLTDSSLARRVFFGTALHGAQLGKDGTAFVSLHGTPATLSS